MSKINPCTLYIVRHGETEWNVRGLLQGHADAPLTQKGIQQGLELGEKLKQISFDAVFSSDATRAQRTAELILLEKQIAIETTKLLREKSYGKFEGKPYNIFDTELRKHLEKYQNLTDKEKWGFKFPEIESDESAIARIITYLREISVAYTAKTVLVVCHGSVMRLLLIRLGFATYKQMAHTPQSISNGAYIKLACDGVDFKILQTVGITKIDPTPANKR